MNWNLVTRFDAWVYMTEAKAKAIGFTHEGTIYGVPAWIHEPEDESIVLAFPKVSLIRYLLRAIDALVDFSLNFFPEDEEFVLPLTVGRKL